MTPPVGGRARLPFSLLPIPPSGRSVLVVAGFWVTLVLIHHCGNASALVAKNNPLTRHYGAQAASGGSLHVIFSTECSGYFDWQSAGMFYSIYHAYTRARQPIPQTTRLMACGSTEMPADEPQVDAAMKMGTALCGSDICDVHQHPNYRLHNRDHYSAYNKPGSVKHWLEHYRKDITADFVVFLDADQVVRKPIDLDLIGLAKGSPVSAYYGYLIGVFDQNHMGVKAKMKAEKRINAPLQQVGGFFAHHIDDLRRVAPLWFEYTHAVRVDPDSWANTGDVFNCPNKAFEGCQGVQCKCPGPPWISEMYGYVFGASEAGLNHKVNNFIMVYPGYDLQPFDKRKGYPMVLHYGLRYIIDLGAGNGYWTFDKHEFMSGDPFQCGNTPHAFERPPPMSSLPLREDLRTQRIGLWTAWSIYNATQLMRHYKCFEEEWSPKAGGKSPEHFFAYSQSLPQSERDRIALDSTLSAHKETGTYNCRASNPVFGCWKESLEKLKQSKAGNMGANLASWPGGFRGHDRIPREMHDGDYEDISLSHGVMLRGDAGSASASDDMDADMATCLNGHAMCCDWADRGECESNPGYMTNTCRAACNVCTDGETVPPKCGTSPTPPSTTTTTTIASTTTVATSAAVVVDQPHFGELGDAQKAARTPTDSSNRAPKHSFSSSSRMGVGSDVVETVRHGSMLAYSGWIAALFFAMRSFYVSSSRRSGGASLGHRRSARK